MPWWAGCLEGARRWGMELRRPTAQCRCAACCSQRSRSDASGGVAPLQQPGSWDRAQTTPGPVAAQPVAHSARAVSGASGPRRTAIARQCQRRRGAASMAGFLGQCVRLPLALDPVAAQLAHSVRSSRRAMPRRNAASMVRRRLLPTLVANRSFSGTADRYVHGLTSATN